jgi:hypothetical protein
MPAAASRRSRKKRAQSYCKANKASTVTISTTSTNCIAIEPGYGLQIHLQPDDHATNPEVVNGYFPLPR